MSAYTPSAVPPTFDLTGRMALITGSSRGIGKAIAAGLAAAGANVILNGRDPDRLLAVRDELRGRGLTADSVAFDVTNPQAVEQGVAHIEAELGPLSILVNNAGIQHRSPLEQFAYEDWDRIVRNNLTSAFYVARSVVAGMIRRNSGSIINICSVQSELARPSIAPYAATKGALKMLTKGMAVDWGRHGIRANAIGPGYFKTDLNEKLVADPEFSGWLTKRTPLGRWGEVAELVGAAVFLASDASSFVTGQVLYVDGGVTSSL